MTRRRPSGTPPASEVPVSDRHARFLSFLFVALFFLAAIGLGLLVPLLTGLVVYAAVLRISGRLVPAGADITPREKWIAVAVIAGVVTGLFIAAGLALHLFLRNGAGVHDLVQKVGEIVESGSAYLPAWLVNALPQQENLLAAIGTWLKGHAAAIGTFGLGAMKTVGYLLLGLLLGSMVAIHEAADARPHGIVSTRLLHQVAHLRDALWRVATAQLKISTVNTLLTASYLAIALPLFDIHLPLTKTLIAVTFFLGLLPIVGNLLSNTAITVISLSVSFEVAVASLTFLVLVHKLEYFINARIVGGQINARAWEILFWMLMMERLFGPAGVVAAPIFYAWLKSEWLAWDLPASSPPAPASLRDA